MGRLRLCSLAFYMSLLHCLVTCITKWCVCLFAAYIELQLLHHWGHPLSGNSVQFEKELLIFPNFTGVVRNLNAWYEFPNMVPLRLTSTCFFLHLQLLLATRFPFWEKVYVSIYVPFTFIRGFNLLLHCSQLIGRRANRNTFFFPVVAPPFILDYKGKKKNKLTTINSACKSHLIKIIFVVIVELSFNINESTSKLSVSSLSSF